MRIVNGVLFQVVWFACVTGGTTMGALPMAALLGFSVYVRTWRQDLPLAIGFGIFGWFLDSCWIVLDVLDYHGASFAPAWIVLLWTGLGLTFNHSLAMFKTRPFTGAALAAAAAPLSYLAGARFDAVVIPDMLGLVPVALVWFVVFALVFWLVADDATRRYERAH